MAGGWSTGGARNVPVGTRVALDGPTAAAFIRDSGRPERVDDYSETPGSTADLLRELGLRSSVGTPIRLGGRLWGAVLVSTVGETTFPEGAEQRIADFAGARRRGAGQRRGAPGAGRLARRIVRAGDEERRRLERNLHDGAQQRLVALSLELRLAERKLASGDPRRAS